MVGWGNLCAAAAVAAVVNELVVSIPREVLWRRYLVISLGNPARMISMRNSIEVSNETRASQRFQNYCQIYMER